MTEAVSKEALAAAADYWEDTRHDKFNLAAAMQSLINSTLDRAAEVADGNIMSGNDQWCAGHDAAARKIGAEIRALII